MVHISARGFAVLIGSIWVCGCTPNQTPPGANPPSDVPTTPLAIKGKRSTVSTVSNNRFQVRCDHIDAVTVKQREPTWCWAACAEMLGRYRGLRLTQEQIVARIKKTAEDGATDQSANQIEIWVAMNPELMPEYDRRAAAWDKAGATTVGLHLHPDLGKISTLNTTKSTDAVVEELSSGSPVLMGLKDGKYGAGHVVLVYGATYARLITTGDAMYRYVGVPPTPKKKSDQIDLAQLNPFAWGGGDGSEPRYQILSLKIIDPQPDFGEPPAAELTADDIGRHFDFYLGRTEAAEKLHAYMETILATPGEIPQGSVPTPITDAKKPTAKTNPKKSDAKPK